MNDPEKVLTTESLSAPDVEDAKRVDREKVAKCVAILEADYRRQSSYLSIDDVARVITKRGLTTAEANDVFAELRTAEIELTGSADDAAEEQTARGTRRLLTLQEEIRLGHVIGALKMQRSSGEEVSPEVEAAATAARDTFIAKNQGLVRKVAQEYVSWSGFEFDDLVGEGCIGLMKAIDRYDPTLGYKFSTYATHWIHQSISRAIKNQGRTIRLPVHMYDQVTKWRRVVAAIQSEGREVDDSEVALHLDVDIERVQFLKQISQDIASLDQRFSNDDDFSPLDTIAAPKLYAPDHELLAKDFRRAIENALSQLPDRQRRILRLRYGLDGEEHTLAAIGDQFNLTRERIRQLEQKGLKALRHPIRARPLEIFLSGLEGDDD